MTDEAHLEESEFGLRPTGPGWFVVNARDTAWSVHAAFGAGCAFESDAALFPHIGINISVVSPGQPLCLYHQENLQEDFLVLDGECVLLVEEQERPLRAWDFFHCPAGTAHVIVAAGDRHAIVLAVGSRHQPEQVLYPLSEVAARYGASADTDTTDPAEAYARFEHARPARPEYWDELPWA